MTRPRHSSFRMTDATASGYKQSGRPFPRTNWLAYGLGPPADRSDLRPILSNRRSAPQPASGALLVQLSLLARSARIWRLSARAMVPARRYPGVDGRAASPEAAPPY